MKSTEVINKLVDLDYRIKFPDSNLLETHQGQFKELAKTIYKQSHKFDLDTRGQVTQFDDLIRENVIQKTLEADSLIFVEGFRPK